MSDELCGLSLQGPNSRQILQCFGVNGIDKLAHFGIMEATVDGRWLRIDRAGFTGDLGYEVWVQAAGCAVAVGHAVRKWASPTRSRPSARRR